LGSEIDREDKWPRMIKSGVVCAAFAEEAIQLFYEQHKGITILDANKIGEVLDTRFFNVEMSVSASVLPALTVCFRLDRGDDISYVHWWGTASSNAVCPYDCKYIPDKDLATSFLPLLRPKQRLVGGFKLSIVMYTECNLSVWGSTDPELDGVAVDMKATIKMLNPVIKELKAQRGGEIMLHLVFGDTLEMIVLEEYMNLDTEKWMELVRKKRVEWDK